MRPLSKKKRIAALQDEVYGLKAQLASQIGHTEAARQIVRDNNHSVDTVRKLYFTLAHAQGIINEALTQVEPSADELGWTVS